MTLIASFVFYLLAFAPQVHAAGYTLNVPLGDRGTITGGPAEYISTLYTFSLGLGAFLAMTMIIVGAVRYTIAAGNSSQQGDAKDQITNAVYGLILLFGAYLVLQILNPKLVELKNPDVSPIEMPPEAASPVPGAISLSLNPNTCTLSWNANVQGHNSFWILASRDPNVPVDASSYWDSVPIQQSNYSFSLKENGAAPFQQGRVYFKVAAVAGGAPFASSNTRDALSVNPSLGAPRFLGRDGDTYKFKTPARYANPCNVKEIILEGAAAGSNQWEGLGIGIFLAGQDRLFGFDTAYFFTDRRTRLFNGNTQRLVSFRFTITTNNNRRVSGPVATINLSP